jgi:hypothetical protein
MSRVVNRIEIDGPVERVFDLVTTTRYWPQWHPATIGVGGVTERPLALGDVVREQARIGGRVYEGNWSVVEHARPSRLVLRGESGRITIAYSFEPRGETTHFTRELEFQPQDFLSGFSDPGSVEKLMHGQSEEALRKLKRLVEELLSTPEI